MLKYIPLKSWIALAIFAVLLIAYGVYLDYGCDVGGVMTWHGKVCVENL